MTLKHWEHENDTDGIARSTEACVCSDFILLVRDIRKYSQATDYLVRAPNERLMQNPCATLSSPVRLRLSFTRD